MDQQNQQTEKKFFRLYQEDKEWVPSIKALTAKEESEIDPNKFTTPYRYANEEQAERAMVYYVRMTLSLTRGL